MRKTPFVLAALLAVTGICVMLWPTFTGSRLESHAEEAAQKTFVPSTIGSSMSAPSVA